MGIFQTNVEVFFYQHSQPLYDVIGNDIENLEFVQRVIF